MFSFDEFQVTLAHIEKMLDRRQSTTSFYLSVNSGILAVIGLMLKDSLLTGGWLAVSILLLLCTGLIVCWIWRSLLRQYEILLDWWYARLRELEASIPGSAQLVTREYQSLYATAKERKPAKQIGMTKRELALSWIFAGLYAAFAAGILLNLLF